LELGCCNPENGSLPSSVNKLENWLSWLRRAQVCTYAELIRLFPQGPVRLATEVLRGIAEKKEGKVMYDAGTLETCSSEQLLALRNQLLSELIRR
jgi:hypothetical protein